MSSIMPNQKRESWVRIAPFIGIGVGRTTSNAEIRSVAIISSRLSTSYTSRTFPRRNSFRSFKSVCRQTSLMAHLDFGIRIAEFIEYGLSNAELSNAECGARNAEWGSEG